MPASAAPTHLVDAGVALLPVGAGNHAQQGGGDAATDVGAGQQVLRVEAAAPALLIVLLLHLAATGGGTADAIVRRHRSHDGGRGLLLATHLAGGHHLHMSRQNLMHTHYYLIRDPKPATELQPCPHPDPPLSLGSA